MNKCRSSKSEIINFLPKSNFSSRCSKNCFIAGSLKREMAKKLNQQEAREEIIRIFTETRDFYSIKELETICRAKGISQKSVKEGVDKLSNDKTIEHTKIGVIAYYWIPPPVTNNDNSAKENYMALKSTYKNLNEHAASLKAELAKKNNEGCDDSEISKREQLAKEIGDLKEEDKKLQATLKELGATSSDISDEYEKMENYMKSLSAGVNRWTDNIFTAMEWTQKKLRLEDLKLLKKECKIPENLDYVE